MPTPETNEEFFRKKWPSVYERLKGTPAWENLKSRNWQEESDEATKRPDWETRHKNLIARYENDVAAIPIDASKLAKVVGSEPWESLLAETPRAARWSKRATIFSILVLPCLVGMIGGAVFRSWTLAGICGVGIVLCLGLSRQAQARAVRLLAISRQDAFMYLVLEGILIQGGAEK